MQKYYVLDTNVLIHDPESIFKFEDNHVILPITVTEELDKFKSAQDERGRSCRYISRILDSLRATGSLAKGVNLPNGGTLTVVQFEQRHQNLLPLALQSSYADNRILAVAMDYERKIGKHKLPTRLVTMDTNLRIKADAMGIVAETYENGSVNFDTLYTGSREVEVSPSVIKQINKMGSIPLSALKLDTPPSPNEFFVFATSPENLVACRYAHNQESFIAVPKDLEAWDLKPRNEEQAYAMDLLLDDSIKLVTLIGKAGTGKTLLAVASALRKVTDDFVYRNALVSRPVFPMGKDIGFLPGDIGEKLAPYMQPIVDNVEFLMAGYSMTEPQTFKPSAKMEKFKKRVGNKGKKSSGNGSTQYDNDDMKTSEEEKSVGRCSKGYIELLNAGILSLEPLLYIRGRSIPQQYLIVDEAQNLTPHEVKTIVTRAGEGTKIVLTGDPYQIDNPYVDASSNGLTYLVEKFRNQPIAGHVTLVNGERSELAEIASTLL